MAKHIDDNCIFCKLANGKLPTNSIYEDEDFNVIMDLNPASKGHAIILPKNHASNLFELPEEDASKIMLVAKKCANAMKKTLDFDGFNVLQNNGEVAGQTVFHLHVHLIPRYKNDNITIQFAEHKEEEDIAKVAEEIRKGFS